ncbi:sugar phosphate isomerase/epimerase [Affinibrenneria salicis]|uniref:Sugar phosphate isomerase/epimerase n=1 Tax=Affinibrenneria salicis TaxID=2590031 RepID=A0A5J5FVK2_9GAMM|nr:sugar phosphate isomerase/epimerase [Affinibrenneria salicis]KAA8997368.1 sugar phosphate isomerase/epimerase [Affinibrenneria salicis]
MKRQIMVVTGAYGADNVRRHGGQAALLPLIAAAGADGVEIRRELFTAGELADLPALARAIAQHRLCAVYSAPEALFTPQHRINPNLPALLREAHSLNARRLKLSAGHFQPGFDFSALRSLLAQSPVELLVENDQTADCGTQPLIESFFQAAAQTLPVAMTFDMANWRWVDENPFDAAAALARHVGYIHVKAAARDARGWHAVALDDSDGSWRDLLALLPTNAPLGIEFPLQGDDLTAVTRHYINLLRAE